MNDPKIRSEFKNRLLSKVKDSCLIFDELGILQGKSIIDLAAITPNSLQGFEIKSAEDTLTRLPNQIKSYNQIFDFITILTEPKYLEKVKKLVPFFWGIILTEENADNISFTELRPPQVNVEINKRKVLELLWKIEAQSILHDLNLKGYSQLRRKKLWDLIDSNLSLEQVKLYVYKFLSQRQDLWKKPL